jgi:hypothetical protein
VIGSFAREKASAVSIKSAAAIFSNTIRPTVLGVMASAEYFSQQLLSHKTQLGIFDQATFACTKSPS